MVLGWPLAAAARPRESGTPLPGNSNSKSSMLAGVMAVAFSRDGTRLASGGYTSIHRLNMSDHFLGRRPAECDLGGAGGRGWLPLTFLRLVHMSLPGILAGGLRGGR
jgi:hypothetical protein